MESRKITEEERQVALDLYQKLEQDTSNRLSQTANLEHSLTLLITSALFYHATTLEKASSWWLFSLYLSLGVTVILTLFSLRAMMSVHRNQLDYYRGMQMLLRLRQDNEFYDELEKSEKQSEPLLGAASKLDIFSKICLTAAIALTIYIEFF